MGINQRVVSYFSSIGTAKGYLRYAKNTGWLMIERIVRLGLGLVIGVWVARYLGPKQYGMFNYAVSLVALFAAVSTLGVGTILVRDLSARPDAVRRILGTGLVLRLAGAVVAILMIWVVNLAMGHDPVTSLLVMILSATILVQTGEVVEFYFQYRVWARYIALASMVALVAAAGGRAGLILSEQPLIWFGVVVVGDMVLARFLMGAFYLKYSGVVGRWTFDTAIARRLLQDSWPLMFSGIMISIYMKMDQVMIQHILGDAAVGYYSAAVRLSEVWYFIPALLCQSLFPAILNSRNVDPVQYQKRMIGLYRIMVLLTLVICIPISFLADHLIVWIFGEAFSAGGSVLRWHAWSIGFVGLGVASGSWLLAEGKQRYQLVFTGIGAIVNIGANVYLIPRYGINGAALATLVSYGLSAYVGLVLFSSTRAGFWDMTQAIFFVRKGH